MVEISTSILNVKKGEESKTFFALEKAKTDYFHIDVMDGKFVEKNTYDKMFKYASYIKRISNLPLDIHLMVENVEEATEDALYETAGTIAEICENNGAVGSVIAEDSKQQRKHESAVYTACTWYHEEHQESL